jgi:hypothetical protein
MGGIDRRVVYPAVDGFGHCGPHKLRQKYLPIVSKLLDGKKTATFMQLDRRIAMMMIELQVASQMPLAQD